MTLQQWAMDELPDDIVNFVNRFREFQLSNQEGAEPTLATEAFHEGYWWRALFGMLLMHGHMNIKDLMDIVNFYLMEHFGVNDFEEVKRQLIEMIQFNAVPTSDTKH